MRSFWKPHTQYRAHHSQTRVCARLIGLSYAQLRERREFGRRGGFGEVARCVLSGDHVCGVLGECTCYGGIDRVFDLYLDVLLPLISPRAMRTCFYQSGLAGMNPRPDPETTRCLRHHNRGPACFALSTPPKTIHATRLALHLYPPTKPGAMTPNNDEDNDQMAQDIPTTASFDSEWDATDITHLQPGHLARSKPVRAWERKPASPFTKQRLRVGKVWRRAFPVGRAAGPSNATEQAEERTIKRIRAGQSTQSPLKIVKRLCLGPNDGVGLQWDKIGSPTKRIVTRSAVTSELVALSDEEDEDFGADFADEEEDVEGTVVEILDEDGRVLQIDVEEAQEDEDWQDEDAQDTEDADAEERLADATAQSEEINEFLLQTPRDDITGGCGNPASIDSDRQIATQEVDDAAKPQTQNKALFDDRRPVSESISLPDGFVSPVRRKRPVSRRTSTQAADNNRRRTLPKTFAPMLSEEVVAKSEQMGKDVQPKDESGEADVSESVITTEQLVEAEYDSNLKEETAEAALSPSDNDEWEDVAEEETLATSGSLQDIDEDTQMEEGPLSPTASGSSQHNDLPIRRSPRRKSSSPLKQRSFQAFVDAAPHLVAFSPVRGRPVDEEPSANPLAESPYMLERSVSAPPEEPQMSPRRSAKPRVSDDTALLQAFLNRAAQNKSTRRLSASKRESLSNRRDSDTVRQALASPAKPEILALATLDPNSPSPKKSMAVLEDSKLAENDTAMVSSPKSGSGDAEISQERTTRRSHRDKRRVERAVPLAHTRISLRGNTDPVVLRRSEAQELATTTRANTRKNKGGSVMPTLRLTKLIVEEAPIEQTQEIEEDTSEKVARPGVRNVKWDETLAYYQEAAPEPEVQLFELGDSNTAPKLQSKSSLVDAEPESDEAVPAPVPAAETPSKPKLRKLRAPRTASASGKTPTSVLSDEPVDAAPPALKQKQPKRSRLATPAKAQDAPSVSPPDVAQAAPSEGTSTTRSKAVPRKKATSRLPAPAPVSAPNDTSGLISSPPKKKAVPVSLPTKSAVPKLDFQTKLSAPTKSVSNSSDVPAGLTSPAKRAGKPVVFGKVPAGPVFGSKPEESDERKVPGLSSPAKKRTRRAL